MAVAKSFLDYVLDQLQGVPALSARRMFGGVGLYSGERFFALLAADELYCKTDETNRNDYVTRCMPAFRPYRDRPELSLSYFRVPPDVLEDPEELVRWARRAVQAAERAASLKAQRTRRKRRAARVRGAPKRLC